ncbi:MAG: hypothetical protein V7707_17675 [Motiliproteus sp.]
MTYTVNAWLERGAPQLSVVDKSTGAVLVDLNAARLRELFDSGVLCLEDLKAPQAQLQETVRDLFLEQFLESAKTSFTRRTF